MNEHLKSFFAAQLRSLRKDAGLTQAELAERIGRTTEAVSNIERAKSLPSIETVIALAEALDVPMRELFPGSTQQRDASPNRLAKEAEIVAVLRRLSDKQLDVALLQVGALEGA